MLTVSSQCAVDSISCGAWLGRLCAIFLEQATPIGQAHLDGRHTTCTLARSYPAFERTTLRPRQAPDVALLERNF
jgi:hypothetical protein